MEIPTPRMDALEEPTVVSTACTHCGEECQDQQLMGPEQSFCCLGCKQVYQLLKANNLGRYYTIDQQAGSSLRDLRLEKYEYLDSPAVKKQFIDFTDGTLTKVTFRLPQIHCASCIWLLENLYRLNEGVQQSRVNFLKKEAYLTFRESETSLSEIAALLQEIGYQPFINLADLKQPLTPAVSKTLIYKLGLTGFIFGNIMLMSFPEYLGLDRSLDPFYGKLFAYLNLLLSLPLVFYSGSDYLRSAFYGLREKQINIDVPISIGILSLFIRSVYEIVSHSGAGYLDSLAGLLFFLLVGKWFQQKTYHRISFERDYQSYFPIAANLLKAGKEVSVVLNDLQAGDQILLRNQELIPADGILEEGAAFIDYSFVTGESRPVALKKGEQIFAGGRQVGGLIKLSLTKAVEQSYLVQLWNEQSFSHKAKKHHASRLANQVGKYFTIVILAIAFATLLYWLPRDSTIAINAFSAVLIIACPCAVALAIPFTYGNVLRLLAIKDCYLKNTGVIESIQQVDHIVFDKTGTLTQRQEKLFFDASLSEEEKSLAKSLAHQSGHPRSQQIVRFLSDSPLLPVAQFEERSGAGIRGIVNGKVVSIGKAEAAGASGKTALRIDGKPIGFFCHEPVLREGLAQTFAWLSNRYELSLLSGDQDRHRAYFDHYFPQNQQMHFNQSPQAKLDFIRTLQAQGKTVMMVGDGLNDAGALQQADVGLVLSENNNNFSPACDGVLSVSVFQKFPVLLRYLQKSRWIIYAAYAFAICYNIIGLSFAVQGLLSPIIAAILMPLSSISIVILGVLGSMFLGKSLE